ncbi:MAG: transcriptional repressor LexA [Oscillospiraceae bacterium]|jgi:repressor LexA|nr:transcriptional repressor LexA [Oscillospiraceae bacterium]
MKVLSPKAQATYEFILERSVDGIPPSVREICAQLGFKSTSTTHKILLELEESGYISRESGFNRNIRVNTEKALQVPLVKAVPGVKPVTAPENIESYIPFRARGYNQGELFALAVKGSGMSGAGILDGDIVIAKKSIGAKSGELVAAVLNGEATVRRFLEDGDKLVLKAEDPGTEPYISDEVEILGRVVACLRFYE